MHSLIFRFIDICMLRAGPQDLPASASLLRVLLALNILVGTLVSFPLSGFDRALLEVVIDVVLLALLLYAGLQWRGLPRRFTQIFLALQGTGIIFGMLMMPVVYQLVAANAVNESAPVAALVWWGLVFWNVTIFAHILRHGFDIRLGLAFALAIAYIVLFWQVSNVIFAGTA
ncbi:hypothetical protein [Sulfuriflexus sp.]|uniref:hypothetical protein n=1 Tax=Sulfuriflexus sp. TaxID=2015443 RepID=UPI0028CE3597|nr:hypothetical protein [Sulfuriflexus sp.]MDT8404147.1 hypothetical protein [Sulfuriflexus sp.]